VLAGARARLDAVEYAAYLQAIRDSKFKAILNEKIPPVSPPVALPPSRRWELVDAETRTVQGHPDIRIARRAETVSRLADVARERGEVSDGLRRVIVIQAVRLTYLAAQRLAYVEGRQAPDPGTIDAPGLLGGRTPSVPGGQPTMAAAPPSVSPTHWRGSTDGRVQR
jgi:hypothetical protein